MDGMNPSALKEGLRKKILNAMSGLTAEKLAESSRRLCGRLMELKEFHDSKAIAVYVSLAHEVNTRPIIEEAFRMSKRVYIPLIRKKEMVMLRVFSQQELDSFEPSPKMKLIQPPLTTSDNKERPNVFVESAEDLKIIITPGVGFEEEKDAKLGVKRMGYGGGYYDRFLTQVKEHRASQQSAMPLTVAMALDCQIVQDLPMSESDVRIARLLRE